jgi:hypothetical protein
MKFTEGNPTVIMRLMSENKVAEAQSSAACIIFMMTYTYLKLNTTLVDAVIAGKKES